MKPDEAGARLRVGVVGLGYVGSAVAAGFGGSPRFHDPAKPGSIPLVSLAADSDVIFVCVPTPALASGGADRSMVDAVIEALDAAGSEAVVVVKSTVPPGTTLGLSERHPRLRLVASPEFLRERLHLDDFARPARILLGWTPGADDVARSRLRALCEGRFPAAPLVEMSATEAELAKYASNALFGVKVAFANELAELAGSVGAEWETVRKALVLDPRIGNDHLAVPGPDGKPGFGGRCLPKDMAGLIEVARVAGHPVEVVEAAVASNARRRSE